MDTPLAGMPDSFTAGTTVSIEFAMGDWPSSDGWTMKLYLAGASAAYSVAGSVSGTSWLVTIPAGAALLPGSHRWTAAAEKAGPPAERKVIAQGLVVVEPDITAAAAGEWQAWCEKTLPILEASIAGNMTEDVQRYVIGDRALQRYTLDEKLRLRMLLKNELAAVRRGGEFSRPVYFTFGPRP